MSAVLGTYARANVEFERGEGAYLYTANGERYLDFAAGVAVNVLGHAHPHLVAAIRWGCAWPSTLTATPAAKSR